MDLAKKTGTGIFRHPSNRRWPAQNDSLVQAILTIVPPSAGIVDIGAGAGRYVQKLRDAGRRCYGVDGIHGIAEITEGRVLQYDLSKPIQWSKPMQWAICIEVGEHIPPVFERVFLENLASAATDGIFLTWASRDQADMGWGHVNCLDAQEVADRMLAVGWRVSWFETRAMRRIARRPFRKKLLVLRPS